MTSDPRALIGILRTSHDQLAALAGPLSPDQLRAQSYDTDWTVAQVLSHLGSGAEIAAMNLSGALSGTFQIDQAAFQPIWDAWNSKTPEAQAADALTWDEQHVSRLEQLTDDELAGIRFDFIGRELDAAGLIRLRLSEHAVHTWDVAVAIDPAATVLPAAVPEALEQIGGLSLRGPVVPRIPDRLEHGRVHGAVPAQRGVQVQRRDLGAAAQVGEDLSDGPVGVVGLRPELAGAERLDQRGQPVMGVAQDADQGTGV